MASSAVHLQVVAAGWILLVFGLSVGDSLVRIDCDRGSSGGQWALTAVYDG